MEVDDGFAAGGGQEEGAFFFVVQVEVEGDGCGDVGVFQEILGHLNGREVCGVVVIDRHADKVALGGFKEGLGQGAVFLVAREDTDPRVSPSLPGRVSPGLCGRSGRCRRTRLGRLRLQQPGP